MNKLAAYYKEGFSKVEGWVQPGALSALEALNTCIPAEDNECGVCEIGVHHGKFFLAMLACAGSKASLAIDILKIKILTWIGPEADQSHSLRTISHSFPHLLKRIDDES